MKLSVVFFSSFIQLPLCARPAGDRHEISLIQSSSAADDSAADDTEQPRDPGTTHARCSSDFAKETINGRCKAPGESTRDFIWTADPILGWDKHDWCDIECCDTKADVDNHKLCKCTPYGRRYKGFGWGHDVVNANSPKICCGRDSANKPSTLTGGRCGCIAINGTGSYGSNYDRDCCSQKSEKGQCVPGSCAKKGSEGMCCRILGDNEPRARKSSCPCFHSGETPNPNDLVDFGNCCSGKKSDADEVCGCIKDGETSLPDGANEQDCCTGKTTDDKKHCVASTCSGVGTLIQGGDHCCSKKVGKSKDGKDVCLCLVSGADVPDDGGPLDCCSKKMDKNRKCAFLRKGDSIGKGTNATDVCMSRSATATGECRCIPTGSDTSEDDQCCSGAIREDKKCGCMAVGEVLTHGARQSNCCTGTADAAGVCRCAAAGAPVPKGNSSECCAGKDASGKHCGCFGPNTTIGSQRSEHCCGGSHRFEDGRCVCIKSGYAVGPWVPADACCSKQKSDGVCA